MKNLENFMKEENLEKFEKRWGTEHGKKRTRIDNTSEFCHNIAAPFEKPPKIGELSSILFNPFSLKIPLSPALYNKCEKKCLIIAI
ncbi:7613_t:CDS:2 [Entrophospora sp. SA101]|nr:7613_t:CDS:2 [Entrophospora sp. SA101]